MKIFILRVLKTFITMSFGIFMFLMAGEINKGFNNIQKQTQNKTIINPVEIQKNSNIESYIMKINPKVYPELASLIAKSIESASIEFKVDPIIILAIIHQESTFYPFAVSSAECIGLMQIHLKIWKKNLIENNLIKNEFDLYNPTINVRCGTYILNHYLEIEDGDYRQALQRYYGVKTSEEYYNKISGKVFNYIKIYEEK